MEVVREVTNYETAVAGALALKPTVVVLELSLRHGNAVVTSAAIMRRVPDTTIVACIRHHDDAQVRVHLTTRLVRLNVLCPLVVCHRDLLADGPVQHLRLCRGEGDAAGGEKCLRRAS